MAKRSTSTPLSEQLKPLTRTLADQREAQARAEAAARARQAEANVFRTAVADVTPLLRPLPYPHPPRYPIAKPLQRLRDDAEVMHDAMTDHWPWNEIESGEELLYLRPGQRTDTLKKLRRGHWVVQAQTDLHGLNTDEARALVVQFLHECVKQDRRCVRIIHGKGYGSRNREPVLKNKLRNWLVQRDEVLAFSQARPVDGGAGAVVVLLRGRRG